MKIHLHTIFIHKWITHLAYNCRLHIIMLYSRSKCCLREDADYYIIYMEKIYIYILTYDTLMKKQTINFKRYLR